MVVASGAEGGGVQQPVGRFDYSASVLNSGLKCTLVMMHTGFFLDHHISQQLMQMPIAQTLTFIFATIFAVHGLTHVARIYILYLIITLFVAKMGSPGCTSPATPRCHPRFSLASTRGSGRPPATLLTTPVVEGYAAGSMTYEAAFDAAQGWAAARPWIRPERSFCECAQCSGAANMCMDQEQYGSVLTCMGEYVPTRVTPCYCRDRT